MVTGLFMSRESAELAYRSATRLGYANSDIDVLMSEETRNRYFPPGHDTTTDLSSNATEDDKAADNLGGPAGGTIGTIAPALAGVGTLLLVPVLGAFAAGPIAVALTAAGAVGLAGALIGALTKWGIPQRRIEEYEQRIRAGGILMGVKPRSDTDASDLVQQWQSSGGELVHS
jgi:FtsH-binding integral membrane protein